MTESALLIAIAATGLVLLSLGLAIAIMKGIREARVARSRAIQKKMEPGLLRYIAAPEGRLAEFVTVPAGGLARRAAAGLLLQHADLLKGDARDRIAGALEELGEVAREIRRLHARSWWTRAEAAQNLGLARSERAVGPLSGLLQDPDPEVRLRAARALGEIGGSFAVRPLVQALTEPSRWSTLRVADVLSRMGPEAEEELIHMYPRLPRGARIAAMDILGRLRRPSSVSFLEQRLRDEDPDVRARAAHALGQIADPTSPRPLIDAMRDPEWPVRAMAAKALGRCRVPEAIAALQAGLADREWWVRSNSALALRDMGKGGTRALLDSLDSRDEYARHQAVLMLEEIGLVDRCVEKMRPGPEEGEAAEERALARGIVEKVALLGQTDRLSELARTHPDPEVRRSLAGLLGRELAAVGEGA